MRHVSLVLFLGLVFATMPLGLRRASAQERVIVSEADIERSVQIETADPVLAPPTVLLREGRYDPVAGVSRARYRLDAAEFGERDPEASARAFLEAHWDEFGLALATDDLQLERVIERSRSRHMTFRQLRDGVPVFGGDVKVNVDGGGRPTMVISNYRPHVARATIDPQQLSSEEALSIAAARAGGRIVLVVEPELVIYPSDAPRIAWHFVARPLDDSAEWSILIDAASGEPIIWLDQSSHGRKRDFAGASPQRIAREGSPQPRVEAAAAVDGLGSVFDPDPLTTAGVQYGPPYVNAGDADIPELNAERRQVPLRDIARGVDGQYRLEGPYVRIVSGTEIGAPYTPPVLSSPDGFHFGRGNDFFEAVNAYYHIDKSQRYIQELDPQLDIHNFQIRVNPHGMGAADNSQYRPASNVLLFGRGGIDDAEDAHVILHEYGHALLQASAPGLIPYSEGAALHEGWADYWAATYTRHLIESGQVPFRDWRKVFTWDGNESWEGRWLDHMGRYPDDTPCATAEGYCSIWEDGRLWATTLMEIYSILGKQVTDHLNLLSHAYLIAPATMRDAAEAILQADQDYYGGAHLSVILEIFRNRGFVGAGDYAPQIVHNPPPTTEEQASILFEAVVFSEATSIVEVRVVVTGVDGIEHFRLDQVGESTYAAEIPTDGIEGEMRYYIEVLDDANNMVRYPSAAPDEVIAIEVGADRKPPEIIFEPPPSVNIADFPSQIIVKLIDRMGIQSAWVEYETTIDGETEQGTFDLEADGDVFQGYFPALAVTPGTVVSYRIHARDASQSGNETVAPEDGWYSMEITSGSIVRYYSFEGDTNEGVISDGVWERGAPSYGTTFAWSGNTAWGTVIDGRYPDQKMVSSLTFPPMTVRGASGAYLVFWHWYDMEHDGRALPERRGPATLWDGGNVKITTNGGTSWELLQPEGGYSGRISDAYGNPLGGESGFGGYSRGWRREILPLPTNTEFQIRFDFGTDAANSEVSEQFAGWYIDDLQIRTDRPDDDAAIEFVEVPEPVMARGTTYPEVHLTTVVESQAGVESVMLYSQLYDIYDRLARADTFAFNMSANDRTRFSLDYRPQSDLEPGYTAKYQLRAVDYSGNEVWATAGGEGFQINYLYIEEKSVLDGLVNTGLWTWTDYRWVTAWRHDPVSKSSLLIGPLDLPLDVDRLQLHVDHHYEFEEGVGGNVKISDTDGRSWTILEPAAGYDADFTDAGHEMSGESIFFGKESDVKRSVFDLSAYEGKQVRIRLDYGASRAATQNDWWSVQDIVLSMEAQDDELEVPRELSLHTIYPNPFTSTTTIGYTLPKDMIILLEVYDPLGRRIDVIRYALQLAGSHTLTYDGSHLGAGVYFLSLSAEGRRKVQTMVRAR